MYVTITSLIRSHPVLAISVAVDILCIPAKEKCDFPTYYDVGFLLGCSPSIVVEDCTQRLRQVYYLALPGVEEEDGTDHSRVSPSPTTVVE